MTADTEAMTLAIARRILADPTANADRKRWADDVVLWLEFGDMKAAARCWHSQEPTTERAAA